MSAGGYCELLPNVKIKTKMKINMKMKIELKIKAKNALLEVILELARPSCAACDYI